MLNGKLIVSMLVIYWEYKLSYVSFGKIMNTNYDPMTPMLIDFSGGRIKHLFESIWTFYG